MNWNVLVKCDISIGPREVLRRWWGTTCLLLLLLLFLSSPRSTEEVIALFISIAFVVDALKGTVKSKEEDNSIYTIRTIQNIYITDHSVGYYAQGIIEMIQLDML